VTACAYIALATAGAILLMNKRPLSRPKFSRASDEMRRLSALLGDELLRWPDVTERPMFGMRAFYRKDTVFALLPAARTMDRPNSIAYKLADKDHTMREGKKWRLFDVEDESGITEALQVLDEAYCKAKMSPPRKKK
jgi:hypothetical protein